MVERNIMKNEKFYKIENAVFVGGYTSTDHNYIVENTDEVYVEEMLFISTKQENVYWQVSNMWKFYGTYCQVDQIAVAKGEADALNWINKHCDYDNWTENVDEIMYDTTLNESEIYFSCIFIE